MPVTPPGRSDRDASLRGRPADGVLESRVRHHLVDEPPLRRARALDAFLRGAKGIREVAPHLALVGDAGEPAGAGQNREQRQLRQRNGGAAVIGEHDVVGGERQFVAAARRRAADGAQVFLAGDRARIFDGVARLVGELAEVDLVGMRGAGEHSNVGTGAEDAVLAGPEDHDLDLGMLETQALHGIAQFDVDAEIVGIELELVALEQAGILVDVQHELGGIAVERQPPVAIARRLGLEIDAWRHALPLLASSPGHRRTPWPHMNNDACALYINRMHNSASSRQASEAHVRNRRRMACRVRAAGRGGAALVRAADGPGVV